MIRSGSIASVAVILVTAACVQRTTVSEQAGAIARASEPSTTMSGEIPITTSSVVARTHFEKGEHLLDVGRPREAREHFRRAVAEDSTFAYGYVNLAFAAASTQEFKENLDRAERHLTTASKGEQLLVAIARSLLDNNADGRLATAKQLVRAYPDAPRAWISLGLAHAALNEHEAARAAYARSAALDPSFFLAHSSLGFSYLFNEPRDFQKARDYMQKAIATDPKEGKGHEFLGDAYRALNQLEQARASYTRAVELDPAVAVAVLKKGHINSFLGNYDEARAAYDAAIADGQENEKIIYGVYRAYVGVHEGKPQAAIDELVTLAKKTPAGVPTKQITGAQGFALVSALQIALHHDLFTESDKVMAMWVPVVRADAKAVGDADNSRLTEATILAWESQSAARKGDFTTALAKAEEHKRLVENDANPRRFEQYHALHGLIALEQKRFAEAVPHYRQANLTDVYEKFHLAVALEGAGHTAEARKLFQDVASFNFNSIGYALTRKEASKKGMAAN